VFSPRIAWGGSLRTVGRTIGVRDGPGPGVELAWYCVSVSLSLDGLVVGVGDLCCLSGDLDGDEVGLCEPSIIKLRSLTDPGWKDCMRRCAEPLTRALSGELSFARFEGGGSVGVLSLARSLSAACAD
jgi:hypothetical protein